MGDGTSGKTSGHSDRDAFQAMDFKILLLRGRVLVQSGFLIYLGPIWDFCDFVC